MSHGYAMQGGWLHATGSWAETVWAKIYFLKIWLNEYDWLMWIDSDAMVMNHAIKLEDTIGKCGDRDLIICRDYPSSGKNTEALGINCGVFLIRNCEWSIQFLNDIDKRKPEYLSHRFPEQEAMEEVMCASISHVAKVHNPLLNQFWVTWQPGDFIVHHAGGSVEDKVKGLTPFLEKVIR